MLDTPLSTVTISEGRRVAASATISGRQSVAETESIGHQEIDVRKPKCPQRAHDERTAGRAVGVEIADDQHPAGLAMRSQQRCGRLDAVERAHRQQPLQR